MPCDALMAITWKSLNLNKSRSLIWHNWLLLITADDTFPTTVWQDREIYKYSSNNSLQTHNFLSNRLICIFDVVFITWISLLERNPCNFKSWCIGLVQLQWYAYCIFKRSTAGRENDSLVSLPSRARCPFSVTGQSETDKLLICQRHYPDVKRMSIIFADFVGDSRSCFWRNLSVGIRLFSG